MNVPPRLKSACRGHSRFVAGPVPAQFAIADIDLGVADYVALSDIYVLSVWPNDMAQVIPVARHHKPIDTEQIPRPIAQRRP